MREGVRARVVARDTDGAGAPLNELKDRQSVCRSVGVPCKLPGALLLGSFDTARLGCGEGATAGRRGACGHNLFALLAQRG